MSGNEELIAKINERLAALESQSAALKAAKAALNGSTRAYETTTTAKPIVVVAKPQSNGHSGKRHHKRPAVTAGTNARTLAVALRAAGGTEAAEALRGKLGWPRQLVMQTARNNAHYFSLAKTKEGEHMLALTSLGSSRLETGRMGRLGLPTLAASLAHHR